jgi:heme/copper-type cytochrome/quinol oxidase subunit 2
MTRTRRNLGLLLMTAGACLVAVPMVTRLGAQEAPNRREFALNAKDYKFVPDRLEVTQNDLVKVTITSADVAYSFTIDPPYRLSKRVPAGGSVTFEFRVESGPGTFDFYSNMTSDPRHKQMKGQLVVRPR